MEEHPPDSQSLQPTYVPMAFELLWPSWEEARSELLQQMHLNNVQEIPEIANITERAIAQQEYRELLEYIFRMQFGTLPLMLELGPPPLLALGGPPPLLALGGPPRLLALGGPPRLLAIEGAPLPIALDARPFLPASESYVPRSDKTDTCSELQERTDIEEQEQSEIVPVCSRESAELLPVPALEIQQPENTFHPAALIAKIQKWFKNYKNKHVSNPEVPEHSDPRQLLRDLNFGEMKAGYLETETIGDLEMESQELSSDLEMEPQELNSDLDTRCYGYLETKEWPTNFPSDSQRPNEVVETPEETNEVLNAALLNSKGNCLIRPDEREDGESINESYSEERNYFYTMLGLRLMLLFGLAFLTLGGIQLYRALNESRGKDQHPQNATTLMTDMLFRPLR